MKGGISDSVCEKEFDFVNCLRVGGSQPLILAYGKTVRQVEGVLGQASDGQDLVQGGNCSSQSWVGEQVPSWRVQYSRWKENL